MQWRYFLSNLRFCHDCLSSRSNHKQPLASGSKRPSDIANLPRAFGHTADTRIHELAVRWPKYLILLVGAQGLEPWSRGSFYHVSPFVPVLNMKGNWELSKHSRCNGTREA